MNANMHNMYNNLHYQFEIENSDISKIKHYELKSATQQSVFKTKIKFGPE